MGAEIYMLKEKGTAEEKYGGQRISYFHLLIWLNIGLGFFHLKTMRLKRLSIFKSRSLHSFSTSVGPT